ncbi:uncharacterized protein LOC129596871 isoform X2 [Paramacrobiotus metropolitanus]|uniref:uncharacterized protein LOC129596871 isoform X2 n=1 Tax=Paramacrobiotus metropolitanus TaxID=2943436 RepID=UPI002445991E|nr:uncharacterized protein LOC129596871 isoform X2 [Paramacrobiotus metropolitanus]
MTRTVLILLVLSAAWTTSIRCRSLPPSAQNLIGHQPVRNHSQLFDRFPSPIPVPQPSYGYVDGSVDDTQIDRTEIVLISLGCCAFLISIIITLTICCCINDKSSTRKISCLERRSSPPSISLSPTMDSRPRAKLFTALPRVTTSYRENVFIQNRAIQAREDRIQRSENFVRIWTETIRLRTDTAPAQKRNILKWKDVARINAHSDKWEQTGFQTGFSVTDDDRQNEVAKFEAKVVSQMLSETFLAWEHTIVAPGTITAVRNYSVLAWENIVQAQLLDFGAGNTIYRRQAFACIPRAWDLIVQTMLPYLIDVEFFRHFVTDERNTSTINQYTTKFQGGLMKSKMAKSITEICKEIALLPNPEFLSALCLLWTCLSLTVCHMGNLIQDLVNQSNNPIKDDPGSKILMNELSLMMFRDCIVCHEFIRTKLRTAIMNKRKHEEFLGEGIMRGIYDMLTDLGKGAPYVYDTILGDPDLMLLYNRLWGQFKTCVIQRQDMKFVEKYNMLLGKSKSEGNKPEEIVLFGRTCRYSYRITDYLGGGSFGAVYEGVITESGNFTGDEQQPVAIKVVTLETQSKLMEDNNKWTSWCRRMNTIVELNHPHIVTYHKVTLVAASRGALVEIMMDYCDGDLSDLLERQKRIRLHVSTDESTKLLLDCPAVVRYASEIADGLQFLHYNDIVHGDLKPANILTRFSRQEIRMIIGDLDDSVQLQRFDTRSCDIQHIRGTIRYMAPEVLQKLVALAPKLLDGNLTCGVMVV